MAEAATDTTQTTQTTSSDWRSSLPTDMQSIPAVKEAADLPSFVKRFNDQSSELGRRTRIPGSDAKPEEIKAFKESVYKAGLWKAPPESPDKYDIKRPDNVPEHA